MVVRGCQSCYEVCCILFASLLASMFARTVIWHANGYADVVKLVQDRCTAGSRTLYVGSTALYQSGNEECILKFGGCEFNDLGVRCLCEYKIYIAVR